MAKEQSLGRGAASIFSGVAPHSEVEDQLLKDDIPNSEIQQSYVESQKLKDGMHNTDYQQSTVREQKLKDESQNIDLTVLEQAINEGIKYPKVTVYSPIIAAVMRYREITTPRFKLSPEAEARLERTLKREDPELWKAIEEKIQWKKRKR
jgi:hypothetical protein